jgi:hypothetical protein
MRHIKIIFVAGLLLFCLIFLFSLLIPSQAKVSRATNINQSIDSVKMALLQLDAWVLWHPDIKKNKTNMSFNKEDNQIDIGTYKMKIENSNDSTIFLQTKGAKGAPMQTTIALYKVQDSCIVNWYHTIPVKWYPWEKFRSIFYDNILGPTIDSTLFAFKQYIEKK